jgi:hypothetical protein
MPATQDNPRGFFEDEDFVRLHDAMLHSRSQSSIVSRTFTPAPTDVEAAQATGLIGKRAGQALWGWKDPRTSLFLDFWHDLIPDAAYLFVYRNPFEVLLSLMRRGEPYMTGLVEGLESWYIHNLCLLTFATAHPTQCVLGHIDGMLSAPDRISALLNTRLGIHLTLTEADIQALYHPEELRKRQLTEADVAMLADVHPEAVALYQELERRADIPEPHKTAWSVPITKSATIPMVERRVRLITLCAQHDPQTTESFFAPGDHDIHTVHYHASVAHSNVIRMQHEISSAWDANAEAETYTRSLEATLAERDASLRIAETYTRSLETALQEKNTAFRESKTYTRSLEAALAERDAAFRASETYARSLEAVLAERDAAFRASETYARSLEAVLAERTAAFHSAETYARSLEAALQEKDAMLAERTAAFHSAETYARSLEAALQVKEAAFAEVEAYARSLERQVSEYTASASNGQEAA